MFFHQRFLPGLAVASYIIGDEKTKEAAIIDPTRDAQEFIRIASAEGLHIRHILETHVHADFVSGSAELKAALKGEAQIHSSAMGGPAWTPPYADHAVRDGDEIRLGSLRLRAVHTPGHTPEHLTWALYDDGRSKETPWLLFTGDFIFVGDVGRPDLLGETERKTLAHQLYESTFRTIAPYSDFTEVFPSHGAGSLCGKAIGSRRSSTLGFERHFNTSLQPLPESQWTDKLLKGMPLAPPYFRQMKKINAAGPKIIGNDLPGQKGFSAKQLHDQQCKDCVIVDTRSKEAFASAHIPGSISIPLGPNLPTWAGWVLPYDKPLFIVPEKPSDVPEVVRHFLRVGLDDIRGHLEDGLDTWENLGFELSRLNGISIHYLAKLLAKGDDRPFLLDVRTDSEWESAHIEGATHIHGGQLHDRMNEVPRQWPVVVVCGSGYRSSIAASVLVRAGYADVATVLGGMMAWSAAKFPVVRETPAL